MSIEEELEEELEESMPQLLKTLKNKLYLSSLQQTRTITDKEYTRALIKTKGNINDAMFYLKTAGLFKQPKKKEYYTVELTGMVPVTLVYRMLSESPEQALEDIERNIKAVPFASAPRIHFPKFRKVQGKVLKMGTNMIEFLKNF